MARVPVRKGSSLSASKLRPQRGSRSNVDGRGVDDFVAFGPLLGPDDLAVGPGRSSVERGRHVDRGGQLGRTGHAVGDTGGAVFLGHLRYAQPRDSRRGSYRPVGGRQGVAVHQVEFFGQGHLRQHQRHPLGRGQAGIQPWALAGAGGARWGAGRYQPYECETHRCGRDQQTESHRDPPFLPETLVRRAHGRAARPDGSTLVPIGKGCEQRIGRLSGSTPASPEFCESFAVV